jgi:hypothetical protein
LEKTIPYIYMPRVVEGSNFGQRLIKPWLCLIF